MKKVTITFVFFIFLAVFAYMVYNEGTLAVNKQDNTSKIFVVKQGENLNEIANKLSAEKFIRNKIVFYFVVKSQKADKKIQAGDFRLSSSMNLYEIVKTLQHGTLDSWVTFIEGLRKEEIAQVISKDFSIPEVEFIKLAPEGYLFPDTYLIPTTATAQTIIDIMRANFNKKYSEELKLKAKNLKLTDEQVITLASLVEREAKYADDRKTVASIIYKRWKSDWALQIDATVQYALGYQEIEKTWWKKNLSQQDLKIDSAYNTYKNTGLPPGPICNPSLSSIEAAVNSNINTSYWYYVSDKFGRLHFATTLEEHEVNIKKYVR